MVQCTACSGRVVRDVSSAARGMSARVTVLVPGLEGPAAGGAASAGEAAGALLAGLEVPGFAALLRRATLVRGESRAGTLAEMAARSLGVVDARSDALPAAALSRVALSDDDATPSSTWLRADPVHLRADMGKLVVFPSDVLSLSLDQSSRMLEWLMGQEHHDGPALELITATCWVCAPQQAPGMITVSPQAAYGSNATEVIARGGRAAEWHARMNEIQMLLHQCPVNEERERDGLAPINSLWYWGEGALPAGPSRDTGIDSVQADDPVAVGAARVAGVAVGPLAGTGEGWCQDLTSGHHLLALGGLELPARAQDLEAWRTAMSDLDARWFVPLARALDAGRLAGVDLHVANGVAHARRGRFWQRLRAGPAAVASLARLREVLAS